MAAPTYTEDLTDLDTAETDTNWLELTGTIGGNAYSGQGPTAGGDGDYPFIQGSFSVTQDCTKDTTVGSLAVDNGAGTGGHGLDGAYFAWQNYMVASNIDLYANGGFQVCVGSSAADFNAWYVGGVDISPYPYGGWVNHAINTTVTPDGTAGTPGATEQFIGVAVFVTTGSSKGEVHNADVIRYGRGSAIFELGDLANGYATIAGFATQNDLNANRWGLIQETSGGYLWKGRMQLGTVTNAVDFRDSNISIFIQWTPKVTDNFNLIEIINASSNVEMTGIQISTLDITTASRGHFLMTDNATVAITSCTFTDMGTFTFLSNATVLSTIFNRCDLVTQNGATITGCIFTDHQASTGSPATIDAAVLADDLTIITNCDFLGGGFGSPAGVGHAIEISSAAAVGSPTSFDLTGNTFTNFGADGTTDAAIYNNSGTQIILNILSGDTPTILNGTGSSTIINNSVTILVQGVTEGAACKVLANETVGTITTGDILLEQLADANGEASTSLNYEGAFEPSGLDVITRVRSSGLPTAAIQDDNGVFTDETTAANSAVEADMNLLPATPVVNEDRYLFGHAEKFNNMKIGINTAGTGGFTITWQYWSGGSPGGWTNLADVVDGTSSFSVLGTNYVSFTMPGDWTTTTINSQGPYYYVRAAYTVGTVTVVPLGTRCSLDVTKYLPFVQDGTVTAGGLTVTASWNEDTIATF